MASTNNTQSVSHNKLFVVLTVALLVIVLALLSAFVWPGWALKRNSEATQDGTSEQQTVSQEATVPSIEPVALPDDATDLMKALPDSVLNFARINVQVDTTWSSASPLEEYVATYSSGEEGHDVKVHLAQWATSSEARQQYTNLSASMTGGDIASGTVKVAENATGSYLVKYDAADHSKAVALWQNDTVVCQITGTVDDVKRAYLSFPI